MTEMKYECAFCMESKGEKEMWRCRECGVFICSQCGPKLEGIRITGFLAAPRCPKCKGKMIHLGR